MDGNATQNDNCPEIEGISIMPNQENVTGVSAFNNEATLCGQVVSSNRSTLISDGDINQLKTYLARPYLWRSGTFTVAPGAQETIRLSAQSDMVSLIGAPSYARMEGAKGYRATICAKLVVTSTPFHQGIAALSFQYGLATASNGARCNFPYLTTNLPHVKIDVSEQTSIELRVPYICSSEYFPIDTTAQDGFNNNFGVLALTRLTSFRLVAGQTAVRYSIYTWLEDVELIGAYPFATTSVNLQAGKKENSMVRELKESKLISKGLDAASYMALAMKANPETEPFAEPTAWFARVLSNLASSFGFSKPVDETIVKRKAIVGYQGESHIDMPSPAFKATPFQTNTLAVDSVGGTGIDEMTFDHIFSKPAMIYRKEFAASAAVGDLLYAGILSPSCFWYRDNAGNGNRSIPANATLTTSCFAPSHLMYVGSNFRFWRGGFKFTFQFSKSKMHGGRVVISYVPGTSFSQNAPISNIQDLPVAGANGVEMSAYTKMFDLRDSSTVEFDVPYINESPYSFYNGSIGVISVQVVSPLNAPATASDVVDMLVYVQAQPDFEFAGVCPSMLDATDFRSNQITTGVYLQAGGVSSKNDASEYVIGEKFRSVKQLAMIPDWHVLDAANASTTNITLTPWFRKNYLPIISGNSAIANTASAVWYGSKCGRMQEMFSFVYGSSSWTAITDDPDGDSNGITVGTNPNDGNQTVVGPGSLYNKDLVNSTGHIFYEPRGAVRVVVPPFMKYQRVQTLVFPITAGSTETSTPGVTTMGGTFGGQLYNLRYRNNTGTTRRLAIGKAAGDDATMGQYIGPPLCNLFQATATVPPNPSILPF